MNNPDQISYCFCKGISHFKNRKYYFFCILINNTLMNNHLQNIHYHIGIFIFDIIHYGYNCLDKYKFPNYKTNLNNLKLLKSNHHL